MSRTTHRVAICASAIAAISVTACSASISVGDKLNNPDKAISGLLTPTPKSVNCPSNIAAKASTTFTCKVVASDGTKGTVGLLEYSKGHIKLTSINGKPIRTGTSTSSASGRGTGTGTGEGTSTPRTATTKG